MANFDPAAVFSTMTPVAGRGPRGIMQLRQEPAAIVCVLQIRHGHLCEFGGCVSVKVARSGIHFQRLALGVKNPHGLRMFLKQEAESFVAAAQETLCWHGPGLSVQVNGVAVQHDVMQNSKIF